VSKAVAEGREVQPRVFLKSSPYGLVISNAPLVERRIKDFVEIHLYSSMNTCKCRTELHSAADDMVMTAVQRVKASCLGVDDYFTHGSYGSSDYYAIVLINIRP